MKGRVRGGVSGPLSESVFFRVAGSYYDTDGLIDKTFLCEKPIRSKTSDRAGTCCSSQSTG